MMTSKMFIAVTFSGLLLTGCFDGNSGRDSEEPINSSFTTFVQGLFADTSDTAEPVNINDREFTFNDQNNENAFDDLIQ